MVYCNIVENLKDTISVQSLYGNSALLVLNRTLLNSINALLPLILSQQFTSNYFMI